MIPEKAVYLMFRNGLDFHKSEDYKRYLHEKEGKELHHLFGSFTGAKTSDYFVMPVTREEHLLAEKNRAEYALNHIVQSMNLLQGYVKHLEEKIKNHERI